MTAEPLLASIISALTASRLEAVLIGNAAAAIGAPVTTVDFDFMFRSTPANLAKLKKFALALDAVILRPYYPASNFYRVANDDRGLLADLCPPSMAWPPSTPSAPGLCKSKLRGNLFGRRAWPYHRQQTRRWTPARPGSH